MLKGQSGQQSGLPSKSGQSGLAEKEQTKIYPNSSGFSIGSESQAAC
jgi:hypothetical protein